MQEVPAEMEEVLTDEIMKQFGDYVREKRNQMPSQFILQDSID